MGLEGDPEKAKFLGIYEASFDEIDFYSKKMMCTDEEYLSIYGDYNSWKAQQLNVQLLKCDPEERDDCKSPEEITKFFRDKFIMIFYN